ncbi:methyltransferase [Bradyrhizobium sp. WYCCWR 13023]|uniref:Methyltransferase n=1 Tax=Bradyrhizobium zhengyangense TaxID=2911009 RepID=A0A9X1UD65_9BRAD|nr:class I SAM-dependent methyltransferase [Bradyrhizobium zhengyangense]MCG2630703.1 methyltransferase [Bradyrhizobium zhengyangense]
MIDENTKMNRAKVLASPAAFFAWCLHSVDQDQIPFRANYPQYYSAPDAALYLWRSYNRRLSEVVGLVRPGLRVLEIGCGIGSDLHWLALHGARVTGIDVKSEWTDAAQKLTEHVRATLGPVSVEIKRINLLDLPSEPYDLIYMKDTFHHLEPREQIVQKIVSLLAPGGHVVIVEPNAWNPAIQWKMFRIRGFKTIIEKIDRATGERFIYGNERLVTGAAISRSFGRHGLKGSVRVFRLVPTALASSKPIVWWASLIERLRLEPLLAPFCIHSVYSGSKP